MATPVTSSTTDKSASVTTVTATSGGHSEESLRALIADEMRRLSTSSSHFPRKCCFMLGIYNVYGYSACSAWPSSGSWRLMLSTALYSLAFII